MSTSGGAASASAGELQWLRWGREILQHEGQALLQLAARLGGQFCDAVRLIEICSGAVVVTGMGKAGLVGQKISATLASTGTRSHFLHPAEAMHGDLGRIAADDLVLVLSQSGETEEIVRLLPSLADLGVSVVAITGREQSTLAGKASVVLSLGPLEEACPNQLAPSTSTTAMMALGDALALVVSRLRAFGPGDFARFHPGGSLGLKLASVEDVMRPRDQCRLARDTRRVRDVFVEASHPGRRTGAIMLVDDAGRLTGIFTDSDLARLLEHHNDAAIDAPVRNVMTARPTTVALGTPLPTAVEILAERKISELPVVDGGGRPVGLIDITDVVALLPREYGTSAPNTDHKPSPAMLPLKRAV